MGEGDEAKAENIDPSFKVCFMGAHRNRMGFYIESLPIYDEIFDQTRDQRLASHCGQRDLASPVQVVDTHGRHHHNHLLTHLPETHPTLLSTASHNRNTQLWWAGGK